jgi:plasmid stabilization system protein ParE
MPYRLSALVEQDLDEIWSYVAEDASPINGGVTHRVHLRPIRTVVRRASDGSAFDLSSTLAYDVHRRNHVIYYRHDGDVRIARVLHGRRQQAAAWSE